MGLFGKRRDTATAATGTSIPVSHWPVLVGRDREWQVLTSRCRQVCQRQGGILWLAGEAGIGKTALMAHLRVWAEGNGFGTLWGQYLGHAYAPPLHGLRQALAPLFALTLIDSPEELERKIRTALERRWPNLQLHRRFDGFNLWAEPQQGAVAAVSSARDLARPAGPIPPVDAPPLPN